MDWTKGPSGGDLDSMKGSDLLAAEPSLGMEARSILKSIETEEQKLLQSKNITRSDRHYFRARYNYYKLCLIRLEKFERACLEPALTRFLGHISDMDSGPPFLEAVPPVKSAEIPTPTVAPEAPRPTERFRSFSAEEVRTPVRRTSSPLVSQLKMIRVGLKSDLSAEERQVLIEAIDRIIESVG